jgi:hypothetical protein
MSKMITARIDDRLLAEIDRERRRRSLPRAAVVKEALALWVEQRRLEDAVRRHREGYERFPVSDAEFGPILKAQRWPK